MTEHPLTPGRPERRAGRSRRRHGGPPLDGPHDRHRHGPRAGRRGKRSKRGDVRAAILALLAEQPRHGYEIIGEISERSSGLWRPSPGSIYPTLQLLADEGLVTSTEQSGKRLFELTDTGGQAAEALDSTPPWEAIAHNVDPVDLELRAASSALTSAIRQMATAGSDTQKVKAVTVIKEAKGALYGILADDQG